MITQKGLKEILNYDPDTGVFTWIAQRNRRARVGNIAGTFRSDGYICIGIKGKVYFAHRIAWLYVYGKLPMDQLDHINGNRSDNTLRNLRECTNSQNKMNQRACKHNKLGMKGVSWKKANHKYQARISKDDKTIHLGYYDTPKQANNAYKFAASLIHKEFARH